MNQFLQDRILRRLESLSEERVYQVLDYIEFLESRYAARQSPGPNVLQKLAEDVQNTLRASNVPASAISETMKLMSRAAGVVSGMKAAAESVATDVRKMTKDDAPRVPGGGPGKQGPGV